MRQFHEWIQQKENSEKWDLDYEPTRAEEDYERAKDNKFALNRIQQMLDDAATPGNTRIYLKHALDIYKRHGDEMAVGNN